MKHSFLFFSLFMSMVLCFYNCADDAVIFEEVLDETSIDFEQIQRETKCKGIYDYSQYHAIPQGTLANEGCQSGTCNARHDTYERYELETITIIIPTSNTTIGVEDMIPSKEIETSIQVLTDDAEEEALGYISRLEDNIKAGSPYNSYWEAFIACYKSELPLKNNLPQ